MQSQFIPISGSLARFPMSNLTLRQLVTQLLCLTISDKRDCVKLLLRVADRSTGDSLNRRPKGPFATSGQANLIKKLNT